MSARLSSPARRAEGTAGACSGGLLSRHIPCSKVPALADMLDYPHLEEIGFFVVPAVYPEVIVRALPQPVLFYGIAPRPDTPPRALGADSRALLRESGMAEGEIDALVDAGEIGRASCRERVCQYV